MAAALCVSSSRAGPGSGVWSASSVDLETTTRKRDHRLTLIFSSPSHSEYTDTHIQVDTQRYPNANPIDVAEREYRERFRPTYNDTVDVPGQPQYQYQANTNYNDYTFDGPSGRPAYYKQDVRIEEETIEPARYTSADQKSKMGYYDEDGELP